MWTSSLLFTVLVRRVTADVWNVVECVGALLLVLAVWVWANRVYARIYGAPLRLRYLWAAHGALLRGVRYRRWERQVEPLGVGVAGSGVADTAGSE